MSEDPTRLRRLSRTQTELDLLDLLSKIDSRDEDGLPITHPNRVDRVVEAMRHRVTSVLERASVLHGWRVQNLFAEVVAALGSVRLLKSEDVGDCYYQGRRLKPADFRIRTAKGGLLLADVKNVYVRRGLPTLSLSQGELDGLARYATLAGCDEVTVAAYWANANLWSLVTLDAFAREGGKAVLSLPDAMMANRMGELGDIHIGTKAPLVLTLHADNPQLVDSAGQAPLTVGGVELSCAGTRIEDEIEQRIAMQLMLSGSWPAVEEKVTNDGRLVAIRFTCRPENPEEDRQGFDFIGILSSMYSLAFNHQTLGEEGEVRELASPVKPGSLGKLIPDGYSGQALPLWRVHLEPRVTDKRVISQ